MPQPQEKQPTSYVAKTTLFAGSAPFHAHADPSNPRMRINYQHITAQAEYRHASSEVCLQIILPPLICCKSRS